MSKGEAPYNIPVCWNISLSEPIVSSGVTTGLDEKSFPSEMPWALADALRDDFIPD
ncbi:DUF29 domain-containing protein [Salmonella enterica]|nr:DUF29 domain-containing protein [Salmonella enterica]ECF9930568.1 DUF29 domain-containing protein [Salmonella enterica]